MAGAARQAVCPGMGAAPLSGPLPQTGNASTLVPSITHAGALGLRLYERASGETAVKAMDRPGTKHRWI